MDEGEWTLGYFVGDGTKFKKVCFCSFLMLILLFEFLPLRVAAQSTVMSVDPASYQATVNGTFQVNITIIDVVNFTGWEFYLFYLNAIVNCSSVTEGPFLGSGGSTLHIFDVTNSYNSTHGLVHAVAYLLGSTSSVSGTGVAATITFKALTLGNTPLNLVDTLLTDDKHPSGTIPHTDLDGAVLVKGLPPDVFISPSSLTGPPGWISLNSTFTVDVNIGGVLNLNYWQAGMSFNPGVLECVNFTEGSFLESAGQTVWQPGTIDNVAGVITPYGASLSAGLSASGNGTLGHITFRVKNTGSSSLVLQNVVLLDLSYIQIAPVTITNGYFNLPPSIPQPPTAFFTFLPTTPYVNDTVHFDASASSSSVGVIVNYEWDFGDGEHGSGMLVNHTYSSANGYNVTLAVTNDQNLTGLYSSIVTVVNIPVGASIDLYTQRGGIGQNKSSDTFAPGELVIFTAKLTNNLNPVADKLVTFYINYPNGSKVEAVRTDASGLAFITYTVPNAPVFGTYHANATATVGSETVTDFLDFNVNWLVQAIAAYPCNRQGVIKGQFQQGEPLYLAVTIQNNLHNPTYITLSTSVQDILGFSILSGSGGLVVQPNRTIVIFYLGNIPMGTIKGTATASVNILGLNGLALCPEISTEFYILPALPDVGIVGLTASPISAYVGQSVRVTISLVNKYYLPLDCNVTIFKNVGKIDTIYVFALPPFEETNITYIWDTYTCTSGSYGISAVVTLPSDSDLSDNALSDGTVFIVPRTVPVHDISVTGLNCSKNTVGQNYSLSGSVTIQNQGGYPETFINVTVYANQTVLASYTISLLLQGTSTTLSFNWNTSFFGYGNYILSAVADPVLNEADIDDNTRYCQFPIRIGVPGDVSGTIVSVPDGVVNMKDVAYLVSLFNTRPSSTNWNPNADINNDGVCNMKDIAIAILHFNQHG